ncbi:MAG TPA: trypsin-like serine protease [Vicinamibacterales bacterium]|nr:trypsin-like serine protease [Vicinamibacterales bacterium]
MSSIVNGAECRAGTSAVVLINLRDRAGNAVGACSGTIIAPRVILTGAHCLDEEVTTARIWLGTGAEIVAESFAHFPNYSQGNSATPDVGIVRMAQDLAPAPVPLLTTRDPRVGETAVIAGWGRNQASVPATLRAGTAVLSAVGPLYLETQFSATASSICSGDSGGPILLSEGGTWTVAGVISAASVAGCTTGTNFYVNIRNAAVLAFVRGHSNLTGSR